MAAESQEMSKEDLEAMISTLVVDCKIEKNWLNKDFEPEHAMGIAESSASAIKSARESWRDWAKPLGVGEKGLTEVEGKGVCKY